MCEIIIMIMNSNNDKILIIMKYNNNVIMK